MLRLLWLQGGLSRAVARDPSDRRSHRNPFSGNFEPKLRAPAPHKRVHRAYNCFVEMRFFRDFGVFLFRFRLTGRPPLDTILRPPPLVVPLLAADLPTAPETDSVVTMSGMSQNPAGGQPCICSTVASLTGWFVSTGGLSMGALLCAGTRAPGRYGLISMCSLM